MGRVVRSRSSLALVLLAALAAGAALSAQKSSAAMVDAADRLLGSLSAQQRASVAFPFDAGERLRWNFIPDEMFPRQGLALRDMTEPQREVAHALLRTGLSARGYLTYTSIMQLEVVLRAMERPARFARDELAHRISIFGTPAARGTWGWRLDGHHVSLHFTVVDGAVAASTPSFAGSNPAEVRDGPRRGLRILGLQEDAGRTLVTALDPAQRAAAIIDTAAPRDILTGNALDITPLRPAGLKASAMTDVQRDLLMRIVDAYAGLMTGEIAAERVAKMRAAGLENVAFAWAGSLERGQKHYYRVQGPTFLIELDNAQDDGNHIHSVWRDFDGDFGRDLLREHLRSAEHN